MGYGRATESLDERALSSASTPVHNVTPAHNVRGGGVHASLAAGRPFANGYDNSDGLAGALPRRYQPGGAGGSMAPSPAGGRPGDRLRYSSSGKASTAVMRDENEAPNNGARLSVCSAARLLRPCPRGQMISLPLCPHSARLVTAHATPLSAPNG